MPIELYNDGQHQCIMFHDLVDDSTDTAVQANQFLVVSNGVGSLIDPSGNITYNALVLAMHKYLPKKELAYLFASHQDPDIIGALDKWLFSTQCKLFVSSLWSRFVPHFCNLNRAEGRIIGIPDQGTAVKLPLSTLYAIPAHFLHAEGNFQFYDPVSRILFSGDMGASMVPAAEAGTPVQDFDEHLRHMRGFHARYMVSNKVCRYWVNMVRKLDPEWVVPQHGAPFKGKEMIARLLDWIDTLECGVDLMTQQMYRAPDQVNVVL